VCVYIFTLIDGRTDVDELIDPTVALSAGNKLRYDILNWEFFFLNSERNLTVGFRVVFESTVVHTRIS